MASRIASGPSGYGAAVTFEKTVVAGGATTSPSRYSRNGATEGATSGEWNAVLTGRRTRVRPPVPARYSSSLSISGLVPENTSWEGPLSFATTTSIPASATRAWRSPMSPETASIAPGTSAAAAISSPRFRATRIRSVRPSDPAAHNAVNSPKL